MISFLSAGFVLLGVAAAAGCKATKIKDSDLTRTFVTRVNDPNAVFGHDQFTSDGPNQFIIGYSSVNNRGRGADIKLNNPTDTTIFIQIECTNGAIYWVKCSPHTYGAKFNTSPGDKGKCTEVTDMQWGSH